MIEKKLVSCGRTENVRTKVATCDLPIGDRLNRRPVFGVEQDAVLEPVGDSLLLETRPAHDLGETLGETRLAATGNVDRAPERSNVRFLHDRRIYTSFLVGRNKEVCLTNNKGPCTVLQMPATQRKERKSLPAKRVKRAAVVGPDGLTFGQRLQKLMNDKDVGQTALARMCSENYRALVPGAPDDVVQQQHIFNIIKGQDSAWCMPLIATVLDVRDLWLQLGIGPRDRK